MSLADRLTAAPPPIKRGPGCSIHHILDAANDADRDALARVLSVDSGWTHAAIAVAILDEYPTFSATLTGAQQKIGLHRKGKCSCEPR